MGATSTRRTPRKSPPARKKSKSPSPSPSPSPKPRRRSKSKSPSPGPKEESEGEEELVSPRAAAEHGIDTVTNYFADNSSTIIITFILGTMFGIAIASLANILAPGSLLSELAKKIQKDDPGNLTRSFPAMSIGTADSDL